MGTFIYQGEEEGCGLASLRMLLCILAKKKNYRYLTLKGHPPYSLEELRKAAGKEGADLVFKRAEVKEDLLFCRRFPLLLLLGKVEDPHMVLIKKAWGGRFLVYDPALGPSWKKKSDILSKWSGLFGEVRSYEPQRCSYHPVNSPIFASLALVSFFAVLSEASLYAGFYLLKEVENSPWPLLFFLLAGFLEVVKRLVGTAGMKRFDRRYLLRIYDPDEKTLRENYEHYYRYKKGLFGGWLDFITAFFFAVALSALVAFNNPFFLVSLAGLAAFLAFQGLFFERRIHEEDGSLSAAEKSLFASHEEKAKKLETIRSLNAKAYDLASFASFYRLYFLVVALGLSFIPLFSQAEFSLNYFLFHFFALLAIGEAVQRVYAFFVEAPLRSHEYDYFLEYFLKNEKRE